MKKSLEMFSKKSLEDFPKESVKKNKEIGVVFEDILPEKILKESHFSKLYQKNLQHALEVVLKEQLDKFVKKSSEDFMEEFLVSFLKDSVEDFLKAPEGNCKQFLKEFKTFKRIFE